MTTMNTTEKSLLVMKLNLENRTSNFCSIVFDKLSNGEKSLQTSESTSSSKHTSLQKNIFWVLTQ